MCRCTRWERVTGDRRARSIAVLMWVMVGMVGARVEAGEQDVVVLGASISQGWALDGFQQRTGGAPYRVRAMLDYQFDKSGLVREIVAAERKPRAVVIKECAAYFPGDLPWYRELVQGWTRTLAQAGVKPVLATVAPVTEKLPRWMAVKQFVKRYVLLRDDFVDNERRLNEIRAYNDWIREYARDENLPVLDLEAALRSGPDARFLPVDLHSGDGLHLNAAAYGKLDRALLATLDAVFAGARDPRAAGGGR